MSLYMLTIPGLPPVLAMWVQERDKYLCFFDTIRGHMLDGEMVSKDENSFTWKWTPGGELITGQKLTLEIYNKLFRDTVVGDVPDFKTIEELEKWYDEQFSGWKPLSR